MRALIFALHKYTGLIAGLLLVVSGLSGTLLVFHDALDEWLTPELITKGDHPLPLGEMLTRVEAQTGSLPQRVDLSRQPGSPHTLRYPSPPDAPGPLQVSVSPYTGEVLATRTWGTYPMTWIYRLHYTLLSGATGKTVVGVLGLCLLGFCLTGLYLWWPRSGRNGDSKKRWKRALTVKREAGLFRFSFDLHQVAGIYLLPILIIIAFSGVSIVFRPQVTALVATVLPIADDPVTESVPNDGEPLPLDQVVERALDVYPGAALKRIYFPANATGSWQLTFTQKEEPWTDFAGSRVWIDQYSGEVLDVSDALKLPAGSAFMNWQFPLHNGDALALPGRLVVLVIGFAPLLFFVTGTYLWWTKRQLRMKSRARRKNAPKSRSANC